MPGLLRVELGRILLLAVWEANMKKLIMCEGLPGSGTGFAGKEDMDQPLPKDVYARVPAWIQFAAAALIDPDLSPEEAADIADAMIDLLEDRLEAGVL